MPEADPYEDPIAYPNVTPPRLEDENPELAQMLAEIVTYNASVPKSERMIVNFETGTISKSTIRKTTPTIGRNEKCSCGSGKKYKKCCI